MSKRVPSSKPTRSDAPPSVARPTSGDQGAPTQPTDPELLRVKKICERRAFRDKDVRIGRVIGEIARQGARDVERSGKVAEAWREVMPSELLEGTWIESSTPSQVIVGVGSAPVAFAVDRVLRSGALTELRRLLQSPGLRVRTRQGKSPAL